MNRCGRYAVTMALAMTPAVVRAIDVPRYAPRPRLVVPVPPPLIPAAPPTPPPPPIIWPAPLPQGGSGPTIIGNAGDFFGPDAYPPAAIRAEEQGRSVVRVLVDEQGNPRACGVETSSGSTELDDATCRIAKLRLRFTPAHDAQGKVLASTYLLPVRWVLPEPAPMRRTSFAMLTRAELSASGAVISCTTNASGIRVGNFGGDFCADIRRDPATTLSVIGGIGGKRVVLWMQTALMFDGDSPFLEEHRRAAHTVIGVGRAHLRIAQDGSIAACEMVERVGPLGQAPLCRYGFERFTPVATAEKGGATVLVAFSVTSAPDASPARSGARRSARGAHRAR